MLQKPKLKRKGVGSWIALSWIWLSTLHEASPDATELGFHSKKSWMCSFFLANSIKATPRSCSFSPSQIYDCMSWFGSPQSSNKKFEVRASFGLYLPTSLPSSCQAWEVGTLGFFPSSILWKSWSVDHP